VPCACELKYAVLNLIYPLVYDYNVSTGEKTLVTVENTSDTDAVVAKVMFKSYPSDVELLGLFVYLLPGDSWTGEFLEMSEKPVLYSTDENALSCPNTWASASNPINQQFFTHECSSLSQPPCNSLTGKVHVYGVFASAGIADRNALLQACPFTV